MDLHISISYLSLNMYMDVYGYISIYKAKDNWETDWQIIIIFYFSL